MIKSQLEEPFESVKGDNNPDIKNLSTGYGFSYKPSHRDRKKCKFI